MTNLPMVERIRRSNEMEALPLLDREMRIALGILADRVIDGRPWFAAKRVTRG